MSGVEIAGLVLGAFPLLISAFEHYRDVAKATGRLVNFESEFKKTWNDIKDEQLLFRLNVELLLRPLVEDSTLNEDDVEALLETPGGPGWHHSDVEYAMKTRLGNALDRYLEIMQELQVAVWKMLKTLGFEKPRFQEKLKKKMENAPSAQQTLRSKLVCAANREYLASAAEYRMQQIKFGMGREKQTELLGEIRDNNKKLDKLLRKSNKLVRVQQSKTMTVSRKASRYLLQYWEHAGRVYGLVQASWGCSCQKSHCAHLWLHHPQSRAFELKLLVLWAPDTSFAAGFPPWRQQGLKITWIQGDAFESVRAFAAKAMVTSIAAPEPRKDPEPPAKRKKQVRIQAPSINAGEPKSTASSSQQVSKSCNTLAATAHGMLAEIRHLCEIMAGCGMEASSLGALTDSSKGMQYSVFSQPEQKVIATETSLRNILHGSVAGKSMTRRERFQTALAVASAHLQLHSTPWARRQWEAKDILFPRSGTDVMFDRPYVSADFNDALPLSQQAPKNTDRSFACLGIVLLELLFGHLLEEHRLWRDLGMEQRTQDALARGMVASKWSDDVEDEAGSEYSCAVKWCLQESPTTLQGVQWRKDLADKVVMPLQHCCDWIKPKPVS